MSSIYNLRVEIKSGPTFVDYPDTDRTIMQSTGLTDKNGKEVFEGDVLFVDGEFRHDGRVVVEYNKDRCGMYIYSVIQVEDHVKKEMMTTKDPMDEYWAEHASIIGNIHENLELLK